MSQSTSVSRRKILGVAAVGAATVGMAAVGVTPAQARRGTEYGDALDLLVRALDELMEGGREPSRYQALRHVNMAIHETWFEIPGFPTSETSGCTWSSASSPPPFSAGWRTGTGPFSTRRGGPVRSSPPRVSPSAPPSS